MSDTYLPRINSDDMGCKISTNAASNPFTLKKKKIN